MKTALVIPAHNEEQRIGATLDSYIAYFKEKSADVQFIVVLNGCSDDTLGVVKKRESQGNLHIIDLQEAGKGIAIRHGFAYALKTSADLIGFVDADMATKPRYFHELMVHIDGYDGIIASRYMKESQVFPPRPVVKEWGRRLVYQPLVWLLFGLKFHDYQCGAKLFKRDVIEKITPHLTVEQWAFDAELMYLCRKYGFSIREWPTVWHDQAGSKLTLRSGIGMLGSLFTLRFQHSFLHRLFAR